MPPVRSSTLHRAGRPSRPAPESVRRILHAIRMSGPLSWSELLRQTRLHRNTLAPTCRYLVAKTVLIRTVMKPPGRGILYSINHDYGKGEKGTALQLEMQLSVAEYQRLIVKIGKLRKFVEGWNRYQKFRLKYRDLTGQYPWLSRLPPNQIMCLVRLMQVYGFEEAARIFLERRKTLSPSQFLTFVNETA